MNKYQKLLKDLKEYFVNLIILQYKKSIKNRALIELLVDIVFANMILSQIYDKTVSIESDGKQLDTTGKWVGADRFYNNSSLFLHKYFALPSYSQIKNNEYNQYQGGFSNYVNFSFNNGGFMTYLEYQTVHNKVYSLGDDYFRLLIKLKIIANSIDYTMGKIDNAIYDWSDNQVYTSWDTMKIVYNYPKKLKNLMQMALDKRYLPVPTGCSVEIKEYKQKFIGLEREITEDRNNLYQMPSKTFDFELPYNAYYIDDYTMNNAFRDSQGLNNVDLSTLREINELGSLYYSFMGSTIKTVNFNNLTKLIGNNSLYWTFAFTDNLETVEFPNLTNLLEDVNGFNNTFANSKVKNIYFPALTSRSFNNQNHFMNMLSGTENCTVHFPSNLESELSTWTDLINGFGGTNTTVLFDLEYSTKDYIVKENPKDRYIDISIDTDYVGIPRVVECNKYIMPTQKFTFKLPNNATNIGRYALSYAFYGCTGLESVDLSNLIDISNSNALQYAFANCANLKTLNLNKLTSVSGGSALENAFQNTGLESVDLSNLSIIGNGYLVMSGIFRECINLKRIDLSNLTEILSNQGMSYAFYGCSNLEQLNLKNLTTVGESSLEFAFIECNSLNYINFNNLESIGGYGFDNAFAIGVNNLKNIEFPNLKSLNSRSFRRAFANFSNATFKFPSLENFNGYTNCFENMLEDGENCTVHLPKKLESELSTWTDVKNGFGGTNTIVLFDLGNDTLTGGDSGGSGSSGGGFGGGKDPDEDLDFT